MQHARFMQSSIAHRYTIVLPDQRVKSYRLVAIIIAILNSAAFAYAAIAEQGASMAIPLLGTALGLGTLLTLLMRPFRDSYLRPEYIFCILAILWIISGNVWLGIPLILFAFFGFITRRPMLLGFNDRGVSYPSFPVKHLPWDAIDFIILKDGILTIETLENRVLQFTLDPTTNSGLSETEFNSFCATRCVAGNSH